MTPGRHAIVGATEISDAEFKAVADLLQDLAGIALKPTKRAMIVSRLAKRLDATGHSSIHEYCAFLHAPEGREEQAAFIRSLTTNMTRFNREAHHFSHLATHTLAPLVEKARKGGRVRFWSAGCSTGEEAYELAFNVLDACPEAGQLDFKILATDIDDEVLQKARVGTHRRSQIDALPAQQIRTYFTQDPSRADQFRITDASRALISFRLLNLQSDWPFRGKFDVIMCRNVAIYFDQKTQARLWQRLCERLAPGGTLYVGHSEQFTTDSASNLQYVGSGIYVPQTDQHALARLAGAEECNRRSPQKERA